MLRCGDFNSYALCAGISNNVNQMTAFLEFGMKVLLLRFTGIILGFVAEHAMLSTLCKPFPLALSKLHITSNARMALLSLSVV